MNIYEDAEDLAATVFLKVYSSINSFDGERASVSTWIYKITQNLVIDYYRRQRFTPVYLDDVTEPSETDDRMDDLLVDLSKALEVLPQQQREIVILHYSLGYSHMDISKMVGLSYANTRKQCSVAVSRLCELMNADLGER